MRRLCLCVALIVLPVAFSDDKPDTTENKVATKDGKVSVVFPHKPTEKNYRCPGLSLREQGRQEDGV